MSAADEIFRQKVKGEKIVASGKYTVIEILAQYNALIKRIDSFTESVIAAYPGRISCHRGCAECCILKTVCALEAFVILHHAMPGLKAEKINKAKSGAKVREGDNPCIFLSDNSCLIYPFRPVICRTHGFPIFIDEKVDFCPKNFTGVLSFKSGHVLDLENINTILMSLDIHFQRAVDDSRFRKDRIQLSELVLYEPGNSKIRNTGHK